MINNPTKKKQEKQCKKKLQKKWRKNLLTIQVLNFSIDQTEQFLKFCKAENIPSHFYYGIEEE